MTKLNPFYITTTLPYVNAEPHIGFAMELIRADIVARYKKSQGHEVFFNTGTDEHGTKIHQKAQQSHMETQAYVDQASARFKELIPALGIMPEINFVRTTDAHHIKAAQEFWKIADKNGLIYKKNYKIKYCVGCELEKTESELVDGKCPLHPLQEIQIIEEENYFFRFSLYQKPLMDLYEKWPGFVVPKSRLNEIQAFVERGLEDFSISRLASKMPWGIPVPNDPTQVMYVWFDALVNYISAIGWPDDEIGGTKAAGAFKKWWTESGGVVQYCGKDNLRQQAAMWQAMLMAVKLPPSKQIVIDGFVTGDGGVKMSKSLGNTVDPFEIVKGYGTDALRYYVARELHPFEDSPFTIERFKEAYNAHLANGLGNLTSRILKMATANEIKFDEAHAKALAASDEIVEIRRRYVEGLERFDIQSASNAIWDLITATDKIVQEREPFKKIKTDKAAATEDIKELLARLQAIGGMLAPILPETGAKIVDLVEKNQMPESPLFMRK
ncbi:methionine--tRNA ligase [Patescibacteria group bacterium]|nr:methionine--tRNA ligase [Patescibacteria group bacterium]